MFERWRGNSHEEDRSEHRAEAKSNVSRRDFLKRFSVGVAAAPLVLNDILDPTKLLSAEQEIQDYTEIIGIIEKHCDEAKRIMEELLKKDAKAGQPVLFTEKEDIDGDLTVVERECVMVGEASEGVVPWMIYESSSRAKDEKHDHDYHPLRRIFITNEKGELVRFVETQDRNWDPRMLQSVPFERIEKDTNRSGGEGSIMPKTATTIHDMQFDRSNTVQPLVGRVDANFESDLSPEPVNIIRYRYLNEYLIKRLAKLRDNDR